MGQDLSFRGSEVIENMVELVGLEPTTSSLRTMHSSALRAFLFNHLLRSESKTKSVFWNVFGTCGSLCGLPQRKPPCNLEEQATGLATGGMARGWESCVARNLGTNWSLQSQLFTSGASGLHRRFGGVK